MSAQLTQLEEDRSQYQEQLDLVLTSLRDDPDNAELHMLKEELQSALQMIADSMADLKPKPSSSGAKPHRSESASIEQQQQQQQQQPSSNAAAQGPSSSSSSSAPPATFKVNETVLARWVSGDKAFYTARIMSVTGSMAAPMYTVKFKSYDTIETLRARDIRPVGAAASAAAAAAATATAAGGSSSGIGNGSSSGSGKRKMDGAESAASASPTTSSTPPPPPPPAVSASASASSHPFSASSLPPPPPPPPSGFQPASAVSAQPPPPPPLPTSFGRPIDRFNSGIVSSAVAQLYPQALQEQGNQVGGGERTDGADGPDGPPAKKFKKIKPTKQLEAGKNKWQEFNSKSKTGKNKPKKESMFRTPEGIHGRVGFTGSGQAMRKDPTRSRHIYQTNEDLD